MRVTDFSKQQCQDINALGVYYDGICFVAQFGGTNSSPSPYRQESTPPSPHRLILEAGGCGLGDMTQGTPLGQTSDYGNDNSQPVSHHYVIFYQSTLWSSYHYHHTRHSSTRLCCCHWRLDSLKPLDNFNTSILFRFRFIRIVSLSVPRARHKIKETKHAQTGLHHVQNEHCSSCLFRIFLASIVSGVRIVSVGRAYEVFDDMSGRGHTRHLQLALHYNFTLLLYQTFLY